MRQLWRSRVRAAGIGMTLAAATAFVLATNRCGRAPPPFQPLSSQASETMLRDLRDSHAPVSPKLGKGRLTIPVAGVREEDLVDTFTQARANGERHHDAIDILAPRGSPVIAAASGTVEKLFLSKDGGNTIYVRSPDGRTLYYYAHLDSYAPGLGEGTRIGQGAQIGTVGASGNADAAAPHLHFAIWSTTPERKWWEEALALNPYPLLTRPSEQIGAK